MMGVGFEGNGLVTDKWLVLVGVSGGPYHFSGEPSFLLSSPSLSETDDFS